MSKLESIYIVPNSTQIYVTYTDRSEARLVSFPKGDRSLVVSILEDLFKEPKKKEKK